MSAGAGDTVPKEGLIAAGHRRLRGRKRYIACGFCGREREWPWWFPSSGYAQCWTCWLRENDHKIEPLRQALDELDLDDEACFAVRPISIGGEPGPIFCVLRKGHEGQHTNRKGTW